MDKKLYRTWASVKSRCFNKNSSGYLKYGGKGIRMCDRWMSFEGFKCDMYDSYLQHIKKHGKANTTIDRIDSTGDYEPNNCRWATYSVQRRNQARYKEYTLFGMTKNLSEWAKLGDVNSVVLWHRVHKQNQSLEHALLGLENCRVKRSRQI